MSRKNPTVYENYQEALVVKDNNLIMSRYNLSLAEQRLILQVVSMINKNDEDFKNYVVRVADYLDLIGSNSPNTYQRIKEFAETLLKKPLYIPQEDGGFFVCNWFAGLKYEPKKGVLLCSFHPNLKPYLLQLKKNFTSYKLKNILSLSSKYSIRLYEILKRYEGMGSSVINLSEFRKLLAIPDSYFYKNIKQQILKPLQKEFSIYTDIAFDFQEIKSNKKVTAIKFIINSNTKSISTEEEFLASPLSNNDLKDKISQLLDIIPKEKRKNVSQKTLLSYIQKYDLDYIKKQIEYVNNRKPDNYFAYLKKALDEDYANSIINELEEAKLKAIIEKELAVLEEEKKHSIEVYVYKEKSKIFKEYMDLLSDSDRQELLKEYYKKAKALYPKIQDPSFELEFKIEGLITEDIISKNEIYQVRLEKVCIQAEELAEMEFERSKKSLYMKIKNGLLT